jgi:two-component system LytT family response regulator
MHPVTALIVDDEPQSRALIRKLLADTFPGFAVQEAGSVNEATQCVTAHDPGLIFLDVQMRGETGFDLLDRIGRTNAGIIFTTAHSEFAVRAFRYSALDYLVKPLDTGEFTTAVTRALQRLKAGNSPERIEYFRQIKSGQGVPEKLTIPTAEGFLFIGLQEIIYCHAVSNYTEFYLSNKQKLISSYTLGYYHDLLADRNFFRVHRSYLINLSHVKMYKKTDGGIVVMNNGEEIEVSRSNKEAFLKVLKLSW